jgi:hypothetical protein
MPNRSSRAAWSDYTLSVQQDVEQGGLWRPGVKVNGVPIPIVAWFERVEAAQALALDVAQDHAIANSKSIPEVSPIWEEL